MRPMTDHEADPDHATSRAEKIHDTFVAALAEYSWLWDAAQHCTDDNGTLDVIGAWRRTHK